MSAGYGMWVLIFRFFFSIYSENLGVQAEPLNFARSSDVTYVRALSIIAHGLWKYSLEAESQIGIEVRKCLHFNFQCVHGLANVHGRSGTKGSGNEVNGNVFLSHAVLLWCQNIAQVDVKLSGKLLMCRTTISHLNSSCGICLCFIRVMYRGRGRLLLALSDLAS